MARGRLKGALKHKNVSSADNSDSDESIEEKLTKKQKYDAPPSHQPYIMKLFDRNIDLARYRENSPLYPMCRAWLKNQPRSKESTDAEVKITRSAIKREYNPDIVEQFMNGDLSEIIEMPRPEPAGDMQPYLLEKPETVEDIELNESTLDKDELLNEHRERWKKIRENWISHRKNYEMKRYGTSFKLLEALYRED
ncbi:AGAP003410-PA-like protein [Anopheles sinensis]|uniref:AGAP003410-PA-like protein n=1 Tax=Anopheles sinensis TaxID=74873 RepID=A0A084VZC9_ANOSI|nr:AGAP003410-PA-like protein [Anopheles sinensis]